RKPSWCVRILSITTFMSIAAAACSDDSTSQDRTDPNGFGVEGEEFVCTKDTAVLEMLTAPGRDCGCIPGDEACVLTACSPDTCDPILGYQCIGQVTVPEDGEGECPIR